MAFSVETLRPHLEALAYLVEILVAEGLFLRHFEKREHCLPRGGVLLAVMLLLGTLTGIPHSSSVVRFLWYFLFMAWQVLCAWACFRGDFFSLTTACMAGFAAQHIANKITLLVRLLPAAEAALARTPALSIPLEVLVFAAVYVLVNAVFARHVRSWCDSRQLNLLSGTIIFLCIGLNRLVVDTAGASVQHEAAQCIYAIICCIFALIIQVYISRWEEERSRALMMRRLLGDSEKQYEQWKASAAQINLAVHDIRHMLTRVQALAEQKNIQLPDLREMEKAVDRFTPTVRTGSDVLDVLLRNLTSLCTQNGITLYCAVYTDCLKGIDGMSLYFLFANAIDNAMEGVAPVEEQDKRFIDVSIRGFGSAAVIHIWNYYTGKLDFVDGLPVTRGDRGIHGLGMKSIELIVERLGGVLNVRGENGVFSLNILLPLQAGPGEQDSPQEG